MIKIFKLNSELLIILVALTKNIGFRKAKSVC